MTTPTQLDNKQPIGNISTAKLVIAFAAVYLIWGSTYLAMRYAIQTIPPFLMSSARFLTAGSVLYAYSRFRGQAKAARGGWQRAFILGAMLLLFGNGGLVLAERTVPSGVTAVIFSTVPIFVAIFGWIMGKRPSHQVALGIIVGFVGVTMLFGLKDIGSGRIDPFGASIIIVSSMSWAAGLLYSQKAHVSGNPLQASSMQMLGGGTLLLFTALASGEARGFHLNQVSISSLIALICLAVFGSIAFTAYSWLAKSSSPTRVATHAYVNPAVAVALGRAVAREPLTARTALSICVILVAIIVITTTKEKFSSSLDQPMLAKQNVEG